MRRAPCASAGLNDTRHSGACARTWRPSRSTVTVTRFRRASSASRIAASRSRSARRSCTLNHIRSSCSCRIKRAGSRSARRSCTREQKIQASQMRQQETVSHHTPTDASAARVMTMDKQGSCQLALSQVPWAIMCHACMLWTRRCDCSGWQQSSVNLSTSSDSQALPSISKKSAWSSTTVVRRAELRSAWPAAGFRVYEGQCEHSGRRHDEAYGSQHSPASTAV